MLRPAFFRWVLAAALVVLLALQVAAAQKAPALRYDKSSEVKTKGVVDDVKTAPDNTVHLTLKTDKGPLEISVAPEKFLKELEISFAKGDSLEVLGSQLTVDGSPLVLARELTRNGDTMMMREPSGKPVWVGWNPRS